MVCLLIQQWLTIAKNVLSAVIIFGCIRLRLSVLVMFTVNAQPKKVCMINSSFNKQIGKKNFLFNSYFIICKIFVRSSPLLWKYLRG